MIDQITFRLTPEAGTERVQLRIGRGTDDSAAVVTLEKHQWESLRALLNLYAEQKQKVSIIT
jgi:hypothetical protein